MVITLIGKFDCSLVFYYFSLCMFYTGYVYISSSHDLAKFFRAYNYIQTVDPQAFFPRFDLVWKHSEKVDMETLIVKKLN